MDKVTKKRIKLSLFTENKIIYVKYFKESTSLSKLISRLIDITEHKVKIQK